VTPLRKAPSHLWQTTANETSVALETWERTAREGILMGSKEWKKREPEAGFEGEWEIAVAL